MEGITDARLVASGGSGAVYRAREVDLDRDVAVKILHSDSEAIRRRFEKERKALGRLSEHPRILTVYSSGFSDDGRPYLITPYLPGGTLQDRLDSYGPFQWKEACRIVAMVAEAVQAGHDMGVIHRDIKPSNILIDPKSEPVVADFGVAHLVDLSHGQTVSTTFTPSYAAPESLFNSPVDRPVDIYGLGATLFALIEGGPPFRARSGDLIDLAERIALEPAPPLQAAVPAAVSDLVASALAKAPEDRPKSATAFAQVLGQAMRHSATPTSLVAPRDERRRGVLLAAVAGAFVILGAVAGLAAWLSGGFDPSETSSEVESAADTTLTPTQAPTTEPDTTSTTSPTPATTTIETPSYQSQVIPVGGTPSTPILHGGYVWVVRENEDSSGTLLRVNAASGAVMDTIAVGPHPRGPVPTEDSIWVFSVGDGTLTTVDAESASVVDTFQLADGAEPILDLGGLQLEVPIVASDAVWVPLVDTSQVARVEANGRVSRTSLDVKTLGRLFTDGADVWVPGDALCFSSEADLIDARFPEIPAPVTCQTVTRIDGSTGAVLDQQLISVFDDEYIYHFDDVIPVVACQVENPDVCLEAEAQGSQIYETQRSALLDGIRTFPVNLSGNGLHPGIVDGETLWVPTDRYGVVSLMSWDGKNNTGQHFCASDPVGHYRGVRSGEVLWLTVPEGGWVCAMALPALPSDEVCDIAGDNCVRFDDVDTALYPAQHPPMAFTDISEPVAAPDGGGVWVAQPSDGAVTLLVYDKEDGVVPVVSLDVGVGATAPLVTDDGTVWAPSAGRITALRPLEPGR